MLNVVEALLCSPSFLLSGGATPGRFSRPIAKVLLDGSSATFTPGAEESVGIAAVLLSRPNLSRPRTKPRPADLASRPLEIKTMVSGATTLLCSVV